MPDFRFFPKTIESVILFEEEPFYPFQIINNGEAEIVDIIFDYNPDLFILYPEST